MLSKSLKIFLICIAIILLIPFIAMQFTNEVNWSFFDFVIAGILLSLSGLLCNFAIIKISTFKYRIIACLIILVIFLIIWIEIAVGIFNSPISGS